MKPTQIRKLFGISEICEIINRERCYVSLRMNGHAEFTDREKAMIERAWNKAKSDLEGVSA